MSLSREDAPVDAGKKAEEPIQASGEEILRLAGQVISQLGGSGHSLATQRRILRLALAWMEKGPSFAQECTRKKRDNRHP